LFDITVIADILGHRSIAMTVPDNELIAEVLLLSEGFITAKVLTTKHSHDSHVC
jgi:hypothetical protein